MSGDGAAYGYDDLIHCPSCTLARFGRDEQGTLAGLESKGGEYVTDSAGNVVQVYYALDSTRILCSTCGNRITL